MPSIEELLNSTYKHFPYDKTFESAKREPLVALHTSGTTGLPKPIIYTHDFAAAYMKAIQIEPPEGFESMERKSEGGRVFALTAPFHVRSLFPRKSYPTFIVKITALTDLPLFRLHSFV